MVHLAAFKSITGSENTDYVTHIVDVFVSVLKGNSTTFTL